MSYSAQVATQREKIGDTMTAMRQWLDIHGIASIGFRTAKSTAAPVTFELDFQSEQDATLFGHVFGV